MYGGESTADSQPDFPSWIAIVHCMNTLKFIAYQVRFRSTYHQRLQFINTDSTHVMYNVAFTHDKT